MHSIDIESGSSKTITDTMKETKIPSITPGHDAINNVTNFLHKPDPIIYVGRFLCNFMHCCHHCCHSFYHVVTNPWFWRVTPWVFASGSTMYIFGKLHSIENKVLEIIEEPFTVAHSD